MTTYTTNAQIGARIKARREYLGLAQHEIADKMGDGKTRSWAQAVERASQQINAEDLGRLATILKVPISYFYSAPELDTAEQELITLLRTVPATARPIILSAVRGIASDHGAKE